MSGHFSSIPISWLTLESTPNSQWVYYNFVRSNEASIGVHCSRWMATDSVEGIALDIDVNIKVHFIPLHFNFYNLRLNGSAADYSDIPHILLVSNVDLWRIWYLGQSSYPKRTICLTRWCYTIDQTSKTYISCFCLTFIWLRGPYYLRICVGDFCGSVWPLTGTRDDCHYFTSVLGRNLHLEAVNRRRILRNWFEILTD